MPWRCPFAIAATKLSISFRRMVLCLPIMNSGFIVTRDSFDLAFLFYRRRHVVELFHPWLQPCPVALVRDRVGRRWPYAQRLAVVDVVVDRRGRVRRPCCLCSISVCCCDCVCEQSDCVGCDFYPRVRFLLHVSKPVAPRFKLGALFRTHDCPRCRVVTVECVGDMFR